MRKKKSTIDKTEHWVKMVAHINEAWKNAWRPPREVSYPFLPQDWQSLKHFARQYQPWGLMALWDIFVETSDGFLRENGLNIRHFTMNLPRLLDHPSYKSRAKRFENQFFKDESPKLFNQIGINPKESLKKL